MSGASCARTRSIFPGRKSWCVSNDPEFAAKAAEIVGLYIAPPDNAVVLAVDEKPSIQALERAQGYLKLPNGRAMTGQSHDYKRHGTTTLFAALNVGSGEVVGRHYKRRRRVEFLDFMNRVVADYPEREIHVILDNLSTHKPNRDMWLRRHQNVHLHYTPTHASWLSQIEIWFSILTAQSLRGASFASVKDLVAHIDAFIERYNQTARTLPMDQIRGPSKAPQTMFRGPMIPSTRRAWLPAVQRLRRRLAVPPAQQALRAHQRHHHDLSQLWRVGDRAARSSHPPLPHARNRKRQLPLQEQLGEGRQTHRGETSELGERLTLKPSSSRVSSRWKSRVTWAIIPFWTGGFIGISTLRGLPCQVQLKTS